MLKERKKHIVKNYFWKDSKWEDNSGWLSSKKRAGRQQEVSKFWIFRPWVGMMLSGWWWLDERKRAGAKALEIQAGMSHGDVLSWWAWRKCCQILQFPECLSKMSVSFREILLVMNNGQRGPRAGRSVGHYCSPNSCSCYYWNNRKYTAGAINRREI